MAVGRLLTFLESSREEDFFYFFFLGRRRGLGGGNRFNKGGLGRVGTWYRTREGARRGTCGLVPGCISALHMLVVALRGGKSGASRRA